MEVECDKTSCRSEKWKKENSQRARGDNSTHLIYHDKVKMITVNICKNK